MWDVVFSIACFCIFYWLVYSSSSTFAIFGESRTSSTHEDGSTTYSSLEPSSSTVPFSHSIGSVTATPGRGEVVTVSSSHGGSWSFDLPVPYRFDRSTSSVAERDPCYGLPNRSKVAARGRQLLDHLRSRWDFDLAKPTVSKLGPSPERETSADLQYYVRKAFGFYFHCENDAVRNLYACPRNDIDDGSQFSEKTCLPVDACLDKPDGTAVPDPSDRRYYRICREGRPVRKRCPPDAFFWTDACRSIRSGGGEGEENEEDLSVLCREAEEGKTVFSLTSRKYVRCIPEKDGPGKKYRARIEECPANETVLSSREGCGVDACVGHPRNYRKSLPFVTKGPFRYSPGYYVCQNDRVAKKRWCNVDLWNPHYSRGEDLTDVLPHKVFDEKLQACVIPSFCDSVKGTSDDPEEEKTVVPLHEFGKHVPTWLHASVFDSVSGYRCSEGGRKTRVDLSPGERISKPEYRVEPACDSISGQGRKRWPLAGQGDAYYDCDLKRVVSCPGRDEFFDGTECRRRIARAHTLGDLPVFRFGGLSPLNDWMEPWDVAPRKMKSEEVSCQSGRVYLRNYDVCAHSQCVRFGFLKQLPANPLYQIVSAEGTYGCRYEPRKKAVVKTVVDLGPNAKWDFWTQSSVNGDAPDPKKKADRCVPGQRLKTPSFVLNSSIYATCNLQQPFVFCPSASTQGILRALPSGTYACVPPDSAFRVRVKEKEETSWLSEQVLFVSVEGNARYRIDGGGTRGREVLDDGRKKIYVSANTTAGKRETSFSFWCDTPYEVRLGKLVTYPPDVYAEEGGKLVQPEAGFGYWMRRNKTVDRTLLLPSHPIEESLADWTENG